MIVSKKFVIRSTGAPILQYRSEISKLSKEVNALVRFNQYVWKITFHQRNLPLLFILSPSICFLVCTYFLPSQPSQRTLRTELEEDVITNFDSIEM